MDTQAIVLVVEDEPGFRRALSEGLNDLGYIVVSVESGEAALKRLTIIEVDVALVDYRLPGMSGIELLQELRERCPMTVLVIVSANPSVESAIEALRLDAYDYLLKPFTLDQVEEVMHRGLEQRRQKIHREKLLRQLERNLAGLQALQPLGGIPLTPAEAPSPPARPAVLSFGSIEVDLQMHLARIGDRELDLTPTEFNILATLVDCAPAVISPQELLRQARGYRTSPAEARDLVKWHIHNLRSKIETDTQNSHRIVTVRNVGYRLAAD